MSVYRQEKITVVEFIEFLQKQDQNKIMCLKTRDGIFERLQYEDIEITESMVGIDS